MLNRSASLAMSTCVLKALPGKLDIKRHSPSILYLSGQRATMQLILEVTDKSRFLAAIRFNGLNLFEGNQRTFCVKLFSN